MLGTLKRSWHGIARGVPGSRFVNHYEYAHRKGNEVPLWHRVVRFVLALIAFALGVVFAFIPGPAILFFAIAGALVAAESRVVAKAFDWAEIELRHLERKARRRWRELGWFGKSVVVFVVIALGAAVLAGMAWFYFRR